MIASLLITAFSLVMFVYWLRYSCVLILQTTAEREYADAVVEQNGLNLRFVERQLSKGAALELERLEKYLDRDYRVISSLLRSGEYQPLAESAESRMLLANYSLMRTCFRMLRKTYPARATASLEEMSQILIHLANVLGRQQACAAE
jgi:hypothetical protein